MGGCDLGRRLLPRAYLQRLDQSIEVLAAYPRSAQDVANCASLDRLIAVDRHRDRVRHRGVAQNVMAATDALHVPASAFENLDELLA